MEHGRALMYEHRCGFLTPYKHQNSDGTLFPCLLKQVAINEILEKFEIGYEQCIDS